MRIVSLLLLLTVLSNDVFRPVRSIQYIFKDTSPVCFVEEVGPFTTAVTGSYEFYPSSAHPGAKIMLSLKNPQGKVIRKEYLQRGLHTFSYQVDSAITGPYDLCAQVMGKAFKPSNSDPVLVDFAVDQSAAIEDSKLPVIQKRPTHNGLDVFTFTDFGGQKKTNLQPKEYLARVDRILKSVQYQLDEVIKEADYLSWRGRVMRRTTESTFSRVWMCGLLTMFILAGTILMQFRFLKSTLRRKKLV